MSSAMAHHMLLMSYGEAAAPITDPYFANVVLLLHGDGTNGSTTITDQKGKTVSTHGSAQISTAQSKFGGASIALLASGDYLTIPTSSDFAFGTGDFTVEGWAYEATGAADQCLFDCRSASTAGFAVYSSLSGGGGNFRLAYGTGAVTTSGSGTFTPSTQNHWAIVRDGSTVRGYLQGVQAFSVADSRTLVAPPTSIFIGDNYIAPSQPAKAYLDDLRVTKGICRYPSGTTFTPPTAAFPNS